MENYINSNIEERAAEGRLSSFGKVYHITRTSQVKKWLWGTLLLMLVILCLPWTQNIRARGSVTTLRQEQRPQELNTIIAGRVIKWFVKEGDYVKEGDTLLQLGEVKIEYLDPQLLDRTQEQISAKKNSIENYRNKAATAETQRTALLQGKDLKLSSIDNKLGQQQLKIMSDSTDLVAVTNELAVYKRQIDAAKLMYDSGSISLTELEKRRMNFQNAQAKRITAQNKFLQAKQEMTNLLIEKNSVEQEYRDKISKAEGERFASLSNAASTEAELSKLQNLYANYDARNQLYYLRAPQSGQVIQARKAGIGEMVKEGEMIVQIVPDKVQYAVEMYVDPMDLPLVSIGQKVRFVFDGFPAIVFSGWPQNSYGTFGGTVAAVETEVSKNGKFRALVVEDSTDKPWPKQLRIGGGANAIALLKDVRIYYELWRNINGFPPEYYRSTTETKQKDASK
ncbi:MAG: HlyD family efflux transporter periplasmic adaptor subunit [Chitinophagaceae bacterium]|nr:HlyD family efflux transporter periplasmic adaptor subunit [Chitinophagaceae bacterium]MEA3424883.1 HlyD family efflux transporter periplasmic adaptor subunit [Bacteroidota bacterium]MCA6454471.1 HlyD family efflux transporter periplasmic adaptor subunit [Chitinophagaceae bacterium]MCA6455579.1 HlyD family efflux transporter periplasmic adaptor subunit [Chitinophagaceae bacterium]MCA6458418.1 HlyD family efflux transporter periplasmic adaptor subunit [Chitinophagaceae bacterium]